MNIHGLRGITPVEIPAELLRTLSQVGYMACFKGLVQEGQVIMDGIRAMRTQQVPVLIGVAIARISGSCYDEAIALLRNEVLPVEPDNMTAKCFLGLALKQVGQTTEGNRLLEEVISRGNVDEQTIAKAYLLP
ncbi:MAG: tetratricopeptide repeat protein [Candidatus Competibacteraceae bacterium]|jgi:hypothetical protein|nr:tetratricopeptide repeat protein [Candidatus Competibacteraceae bacterium]